MKIRVCSFLAILCFMLLPAGHAALASNGQPESAQPTSMEYAGIKSGLIYNFLKLTRWPETEDPKKNLHICLLGGDPFNGALGTLSGHTAQQRTISVEERKNPYFTNGCNLAFINAKEEENLDSILKALEGKPVLTVSDIAGFSRRGGMIEFAKNESHQIYLDINIRAIEETDLRVKEDLLSMAGMVWLK